MFVFFLSSISLCSYHDLQILVHIFGCFDLFYVLFYVEICHISCFYFQTHRVKIDRRKRYYQQFKYVFILFNLVQKKLRTTLMTPFRFTDIKQTIRSSIESFIDEKQRGIKDINLNRIYPGN